MLQVQNQIPPPSTECLRGQWRKRRSQWKLPANRAEDTIALQPPMQQQSCAGGGAQHAGRPPGSSPRCDHFMRTRTDRVVSSDTL